MKAKSNIYTFSAPEEDGPLIDEFDKIAEREHKTFSALVRELVKDYVKKHGDGNPAFSLDKFQDPMFVAMPTLGETPSLQRLDKMSVEDTVDVAKRAKVWKDTAKQSLRVRHGLSRYEVEELIP